MSSIPLPSALNGAKLGTATRPDGPDTVHLQEVVPANPFVPVVGTLAAAGSVTAAGLQDASSVLFRVSGTYVATFVFEASDDEGLVWVSILSARSDANTGETTSGALTSTTRAWRANIAGYTQFRVRASAYTSGTVNVRIAPSTLAAEPVPVSSTSVAMNAGTNLVGDVSPGVRTSSTNALSRLKVVAAATTNAVAVKASAGRVYGWTLSNTSASWRFVKLFNKATAPVPGTDTPVEVIAIPPGDHIDVITVFGVSYSAGIGIAITGAYADSDTTAVAVGDVIGSLLYA